MNRIIEMKPRIIVRYNKIPIVITDLDVVDIGFPNTSILNAEIIMKEFEIISNSLVRGNNVAQNKIIEATKR